MDSSNFAIATLDLMLIFITSTMSAIMFLARMTLKFVPDEEIGSLLSIFVEES